MRTGSVLGLGAAALVGAAVCVGAFAQEKAAAERSEKPAHWPVNEDLRHLRAMEEARLSPDGTRVLVRVEESTADGAAGHLWLVDVAGTGEPRQLTFSPVGEKRGERGGEWMPDGRSVLFLAKRGERTELFRLPMEGGEARAFVLKAPVRVDGSKRVGAIPPEPSHEGGVVGAGVSGRVGDPIHDGGTVMNGAPGVRGVVEGLGSQVSETRPFDTLRAGSGAPGSGAPGDRAPGDRAPGAKEGNVEEVELDVSGFSVSPDGRWVAVMAKDPETAGEKREKDTKADATWVDHDEHGERLYLLKVARGEVATGEVVAEKLTAVAGVPADVRGVSWSRDGARLVAVVEGMNGVSDLGPAGAAWMVPVADVGRAARLEGVPATVGGVVWAADGRSLLVRGQAKQDAPPGVADVYRYDLRTRELRDLTDGYHGSAEGVVAARKDEATVVAVQEGFKTGPALLRDGRMPEMVGLPLRSVNGAVTNAAETGWVMVGSGGGHAPELLYAKSLGGETRVLRTPAMGWEGLRRGVGEAVSWTNEGLTIEGLLYLPEGAGAGGKKAPLVVDVHGGPTGAFRDQHEPLYDLLLGRGWAVLLMNPRGSTGYGAGFAAANKNDLGGADYRDLMAGVDSVLKAEPVDGAKMALMGYSYGGEMAGFVEGQTDRFKAIVSGAPVTDQFSEYGTERGSWYDRWFYGKPWEHVADAARQSPLGHVAGAKTPMLLLQGESDVTDPLGQSQEMYRVLRQMGVPVDLVTYPREDHGPLARGVYGMPSPEPWHGFDARQRMVGMFAKAFGEDAGVK